MTLPPVLPLLLLLLLLLFPPALGLEAKLRSSWGSPGTSAERVLVPLRRAMVAIIWFTGSLLSARERRAPRKRTGS